jgi:hypothetical protein
MRVDRENKAVAGLRLLLGHKHLPDLVRFVWERHAPLLVRSFVEKEIDAKLQNVVDMEKLRLHHPGLKDEPPRAVFMQPGAMSAIFEHQAAHMRRWQKRALDVVDELPDEVKFQYAIPTILDEVLSKMDEGVLLEELERRKWLDISAWKFSL